MRNVIADATNEAYAVRIAKGAGLIAETESSFAHGNRVNQPLSWLSVC